MDSGISINENLPFISVKDGMVTNISSSFSRLSGFCCEDILYKPFDFVWGEMLRIPKLPGLSNNQEEAYLFTKKLEAKYVTIQKFESSVSNENKFIIKEVPGSRFEDRNEFLDRLINDNKTGIGVFTAPDFMLIKANETYLSYFPEPFNTKEGFYGKYIKDGMLNFEGGPSEAVWNDALYNNKSIRFKEKNGYSLNEEGTYYDYSLIPVSVSGEVKYVVSMVEDVTERVMSREHVRKQSEIIEKQNRKLDAILEGMSDALVVFDKEGNYNFLNKAAAKMFRTDIFKKAGDRYKPGMYFDIEGRELSYEEMPYVRSIRGEKITEGVMKVKISDKAKYYGISGTPIFNEKGEVELAVLCVRDITVTQIRSQIIREQKKELEAIIDNIHEAIFIYDADKKCYLTNKSAKGYLKYKEIKRFGEEHYRYRHDDYKANEILLENMPVSRLYKGETINNYKLTMRNGKTVKHISVNAAPIYDSHRIIKFVTLSCRDITQDIEMQRIAEKKKEELEAVIENIDDAIFIFDRDFNYYMQNKAGKDYFNHLKLEKIGDAHADTTYYDFDNKEIPREEMTIARVRRGEIVRNHRLKMVQGNKVKYISVSGRPIYDSNKNVSMSILVSHDITEDIKREYLIKEQQELLLKREIEKGEALKQAMELKDEFLYLITHEFRTPMAVVNSALQVLNLTCKEEITEKVGKYLGIIKQNTNRQLRLVNNLLDITRISSGSIKMNVSSFDAVHVIETIVYSINLYAQQKNVDVSFQTAITEKYIYSDEEKLERIVLNLLSNALKFTPGERSIRVKLSESKIRGKDAISISVEDEGIGIPKEKQEIIFDRFGQVDSSLSRRAEGTGLGLHLVKLLINSLDGDIQLRSQIDKGSTFIVTLPVSSNEAFEEAAISGEGNCNRNFDSDRVIESAAIEFSDIYY